MMRAPLHVCLVLLLCLAPCGAGAAEPSLDDVQYHPDKRPPEGVQQRLILTGTAVAAGWYGVSLGSSYLWSDTRAASDWRIPVAGPWMALGKTGCTEAEGSSCTDAWVVIRTALTLISSIGQVGGLAVIVEGLLVDTEGRSPPAPRVAQGAPAPEWVAAPMTDSSTLGLQLIGTF